MTEPLLIGSPTTDLHVISNHTMPSSPLPRNMPSWVPGIMGTDAPPKKVIITWGTEEDDLEASDAAIRLGSPGGNPFFDGQVVFDGRALQITHPYQWGWAELARSVSLACWVGVDIVDLPGDTGVKFVFAAEQGPRSIMRCNDGQATDPNALTVGLVWSPAELVRIVEKQGESCR